MGPRDVRSGLREGAIVYTSTVPLSEYPWRCDRNQTSHLGVASGRDAMTVGVLLGEHVRYESVSTDAPIACCCVRDTHSIFDNSLLHRVYIIFYCVCGEAP